MSNVQPIIGYFDSSHDCPEEIISAGGFIPYKILGDAHLSTEPADRYLSNFFCPAARSFLTEALENSQKWAGIVVAHGCDATNRHFDIWKKHVKTPLIYWFNNPMNNNATAHEFFHVELSRMIKTFNNFFKIQITPAKITAAIDESNQIKYLLNKMSTLRSTNDISNAEYFRICCESVQKSKSEIIPMLKDTLKQWEEKPSFPANKKRILLTGSDVTYVQWMDLLEEADLRVVTDDLSIGERYFATFIPTENKDPLDNLIDYYFNIPKPATKNPPNQRTQYLIDAANKSQIDGIISQNLKFCEPYAFDAVHTVQQLKNEGYMVMHLEREFTSQMDQQLKTRLEAFKEMI